MSWESSVVYYELINRKVRELFGGFHSCKSVMVTVDFAEIEPLQHRGEWDKLDEMMAHAAQQTEAAGADIVVLCTNTMHLCSPAILKNINIPFLHIAQATGEEIARKKLKKVALLGTKFTMEKDFYKEYLLRSFGIKVIIPDEPQREQIHSIIYNELVHGIFHDRSKATYQQIIKNMEERGAEGVILGCTEIPLLISDKDVQIPTFDTTTIHATHAVEWAVSHDTNIG